MHTFVRMIVKEGDARFSNAYGKYDEFVCRWEDAKHFIEELRKTVFMDCGAISEERNRRDASGCKRKDGEP